MIEGNVFIHTGHGVLVELFNGGGTSERRKRSGKLTPLGRFLKMVTKLCMGTILTKMIIKARKLIIHGYTFLHGGDLDKNGNFNYRHYSSMFIHFLKGHCEGK